MEPVAGRRVLVTGASGFIGSHLCGELERRGAVLFRASLSGGCDVADGAACDHIFASFAPQIVFHLASRVTANRSLDEMLPILRANLLSTVNLLIASRRTEVARFICMGSLHEPSSQDEVAHFPYAAAKAAANTYARMFATSYGLSVTIARPYMVYGPGQSDRSKVLPYVISRLLDGQPAELSSCQHPFDWVHVGDVVAALLTIAGRSDLDGRSIDIGTGKLTTVERVLRGAAALIGSGELLRFGVREDRTGEPVRAADTEATFRLTGWRPRIDLDEGLADTVGWFRQHRE
jgi:nucleoside-diphosphate-sugar epimerase